MVGFKGLNWVFVCSSIGSAGPGRVAPGENIICKKIVFKGTVNRDKRRIYNSSNDSRNSERKKR